MKKTLITFCLTLSSLLNAPAITYGVYDIAQTITNKPLTYEEIFVDQTSATGCSVFDTQNRSFARIFAPMYALLAQYGKPMIVPECGVQVIYDQAAWVAGLIRVDCGSK